MTFPTEENGLRAPRVGDPYGLSNMRRFMGHSILLACWMSGSRYGQPEVPSEAQGPWYANRHNVNAPFR